MSARGGGRAGQVHFARHGVCVAAGLCQPLGDRGRGRGAQRHRGGTVAAGRHELGVAGAQAVAHRAFEGAQRVVAIQPRLRLQRLRAVLQGGHLLQLGVELRVFGRRRAQRAQRGRERNPPEQGQRHQRGGHKHHAALARLEGGPAGLELFAEVHRAVSACACTRSRSPSVRTL
jgi:hypothetical protein